jgi:hypothetical protein
MPERDRLATFTVEGNDLAPSLLDGDVLHFDPARPLDLLSRDNTFLRVVVMTGDGTLQACVLDGALPQNVLAAWPVQWIVVR